MAPIRGVKDYLKGQLCVTLPVSTRKWTGQTIIVTGSNVGMGLEAARHFVRLDAAKVIIACRSEEKGLAAIADIEASTKRTGVAEFWELDLCYYQSVEAFARRALTLPRINVIVANAGVLRTTFEMAEDNESHITVNVVSHMLLALLVLPKLRETAIATGKPSVLTFTGSFTHFMTEFPERKADNIFEGLNVEEGARMKASERYFVSKLIQLQVMREFAKQLTASEPTKPGKVITSIINPGFVNTQIMRHASPLMEMYMKLLRVTMSRTSDEGGRTLVHGAEGGEETHGQYLGDCHVAIPSDYVTSEDGRQVQEKLWRELMAKLEKIHPGITQII
ncbi:putative short-chain dehydrogenase/reductase family protein [Lasiosphaeria hispida]|uniref:Short-chain dehydrogenase/reductase family protein n=1 Tax=Lasiosphaeria hispida TaxID=260671 RepID=A0AAJ0HJL3_9PEZI|nr:putative short-chain dehydrogenase/reductase family protein [Lasiosphaeria hispida]